jgi:putative spermidine/putrescine transport system ATP-binding protein
MGVVFQSYSLFPHMTVAQNVAFPLRCARCRPPTSSASVAGALDTVRLGHLAERRPQQLSGGQQQRVALARALVFEPRVVLMDEPLSALDKKLREEMQLEIRRLHRELGVTMVFVTHDQAEAMTLSDRVAVFNHGRIEQLATPQALYDSAGQRLRGRLHRRQQHPARPGRSAAARCAWPTAARCRAARCRAGQRAAAQLCVRPERLHLAHPAMRQAPTACQATVLDAIHQGDHWRVVARLGRG